MARLFLVIVGLFLILSAATNHDPLREVLSVLSKAQAPSGGFSTGQQAPTLETTANALFLSNLFNLYADATSNINVVAARAFLQSVENHDSGFGSRPGLASDIESTRFALIAYESLGNETRPSSVGIGAFLRALRDPETGLFANRQGEKPSLKASALALQCYQLTEELSRSHVKEYTEKIKSFIKGHVTGDKTLSFSFKNEPATTSSAYYGIVLAVLSGYDFGKDATKFAQYFLDLQAPSGGFYSNGQKGEPTIQSTLHAVEALFLLDQATGEHFLDKADQAKLKEFLVSRSAGDLNALAAANLALVLTSHVSDYFTVKVDYEVGDAARIGARIIQGTQIRPYATVRTAHYTTNHPGFHVDLTVTHDGKTLVPKEKLGLERGRYVSAQWVDTSKLLGPIAFDYVARIKIPALGERRIPVRDVKSVGYGIGIEPEATLEVTGRQIPEGSAVSPGTGFKFTVTLSNTTSPAIVSGNFAIIFSVLDSSNVVIYTKREDRRAATEDATFTWTLKEADMPAGYIAFRFDVETEKVGVHTSDSVRYAFNVPLVAADIAFKNFGPKDKISYKFGDTVQVSITPATYPDVRGHRPFDSKDAYGKPVGDARAFWMDVRSPSGQLIRSVRGTAAGTGPQYTFTLPLEPKIDLLGSLHVQFHYTTAEGEQFALSNYDTATNELYDETVALNFTVRHDLQMTDVEALPKSASLHYGNEVAFRFKVKDAVSGKYVRAGDVEGATVYLSLRQEGERAVTSVHEQARQEGDTFVLSWVISANAVGGKGQLLLVAQDADGNRLPIHRDGKPWTLSVTIGGSFDVQHTVFSSSFPTGESVFIVSFSLACQGTPLRDAQLRASLELVQPDNTSTPVATAPVSFAQDGTYTVSWMLTNAEEGRYRVRLYREADRLRRLGGKDRRSSESQAEAISALPSLFDLEIEHRTQPLQKLPIQTQTLATFILGAVFAFLVYRKQNYK